MLSLRPGKLAASPDTYRQDKLNSTPHRGLGLLAHWPPIPTSLAYRIGWCLRQLINVEVVFECDVLRDDVAVLLRGRKANLLGGGDGFLSQTVRQRLYDTDTRHFARSRKDS